MYVFNTIVIIRGGFKGGSMGSGTPPSDTDRYIYIER